MKIRREWTRYRREAGSSEHRDQLRYQEKGENENNTKGLFFFFFFPLCSMQDLCCLKRDPAFVPAMKAQSFDHWTNREAPILRFG